MFKQLGNFVVKNRIWVILAWVIMAVFMFLFAPSLKDVGISNISAFLPKNNESARASELIQEYFPGVTSASSITLVFYDEKGLSDSDLAYGQQVHEWLKSGASGLSVDNTASIYDNPDLKATLLSQDNTSMLMSVGFSEKMSDTEIVQTIRHYLSSSTSDLKVYVSVDTAIMTDLQEAALSGLSKTILITVILVVVLLLIIYRSPVAALVPLLTIGMAYLISRGAMGYIAQAGVSVWSQMDAFLIVLVFGVGTDYCLFMISRFREELRQQGDRVSAMRHTIGSVGGVITTSAFTVIIALAVMSIAHFQMIKTMGPLMALSVLITLLAAVTLVPALASIMGKHLFWPFHEQNTAPPKEDKSNRNSLFGKIFRLSTEKPVLVIIVILVVLALPCLALPKLATSFDLVKELPQNSESIVGYNVMEKHYNIGELNATNVVIVAPEGTDLTSPTALAALAKISADLSRIDGVAGVRSIINPQGTQGAFAALTVSGQLTSFGSALDSFGGDISSLSGPQGTAAFQQLAGYLSELGANFPWVQTDSDYMAALASLNNLGSATTDEAIQSNFVSLKTQLQSLSTQFASRDNPVFLSPVLISASPTFQGMVNAFVSENRQSTLMYVVLDSSSTSNEVSQAIYSMRTALSSSVQNTTLRGSEIATGGSSAVTADIKQTINTDFNRIMILVVICILLVLVFFLRSLIAPLYLLLAVLLSWGASMGLITLIFQTWMGQESINLLIPIITFVLLVALGSDYNIFLMSRISEESEKKGTREGTRVAAIATRSVIFACGVILAGTFASLSAFPMRLMAQMGIAIAIGVIIDTAIVQIFLLPAIATKLGRWTWWPSKRG
jgi:uncharacterized membrane protein YdfJ with MMPL/SSD domain